VEAAKDARHPCHTPSGLIEFRYHATICTTYDAANKRITDHGTRGWSTTTGRAITWYLQALAWHNYIREDEAYELARCWSKRGLTEVTVWVTLGAGRSIEEQIL